MQLDSSWIESYKSVIAEILKHPLGMFYFSDKFAIKEPSIDNLLLIMEASYCQSRLGVAFVAPEMEDQCLTISELDHISDLTRDLSQERQKRIVKKFEEISSKYNNVSKEHISWSIISKLCRIKHHFSLVAEARKQYIYTEKSLIKSVALDLLAKINKLKKQRKKLESEIDPTLFDELAIFQLTKPLSSKIKELELEVKARIKKVKVEWSEIASSHLGFDSTNDQFRSGNPNANNLLLEIETLLTNHLDFGIREACREIASLMEYFDIKDNGTSLTAESIRRRNNDLKKKKEDVGSEQSH